MTERIGNVILDYRDYDGEDRYADGAVFDELLSIAKEYDPEDFDRVVAERKNWPVMKHFSGIRANILEWYPGISGSKVLELGSGCGALTGMLAAKAASVTCVEASKTESLINAHRNRGRDNLEIRVGRFGDVEKNLPSDYDVITLAGSFECAADFIQSDRPYEDLLRLVRMHLAEDGVLLIAVSNRLGLKYFAGCAEDHTGGYFDGITGYADAPGVRTFAKPELEKLLGEAGFDEAAFYYPYPDHYFPMSVYSDRWLPRQGDLRNNIVNYDRKRLILFDEAKAYDSLTGSGLFPLFSNSYLVIAGKSGSGAARSGAPAPVFTKYSNERSRALRIRTDIIDTADPKWISAFADITDSADPKGLHALPEKDEEAPLQHEGGSVRLVRKVPLTREARGHVRRMAENFRLLTELYRDTRFRPNRMVMDQDAAVFEYLEGETLEERFDRTYQGMQSGLAEALISFLREIDRTADGVFEITEEFRRVFGDAKPGEGLPSCSAANIDMVLNNIIADGDTWNVIDYEWTFPFSVPVAFIKWRVLHYYISGNTKRFFLNDADLFGKAGISPEEEAQFGAMEDSFQAYIEKGYVPLRELYADISEGASDLPSILRRMRGQREGRAFATLYPDTGSGFSGHGSFEVPHDEDGTISIEQELAGLVRLRIRPADYAGCLTIGELMTELGPLDVEAVETNGVRLDLRRRLFDTDDPWIVVRDWPEGARYLYARLRMEAMDADSAEFMIKELDVRDRQIRSLTESDRKKEDLLVWRGEAIRQLMKTSPMKAYRKMRVTAKRGDPYSMLRPLLPSDPEGILYCIDHMAHRKHDFLLRGWCFDREYSLDRVLVVNAKDVEVPAEITRCRRPDVASVYGLPEERELGFTVSIDYTELKNMPLYLEVETARGYTCEKLPIETDPDKRREADERFRSGGKDRHIITDYEDWARDHATAGEELERQRAEQDDPKLRFSLLVPVYRTDPALLRELVGSVLAQTYGNFELILSDGSGEASPVAKLIDEMAALDARICVLHHDRQLRIAENTNAAAENASGDWFVFLDHDDLLTADALYELAAVIHSDPDAGLIYSDEDKLLPGDVPAEPHFKPDFNPDLLNCVNYICHITAVRRDLAERVKNPLLLDPAFEGAQDYDFVLRCVDAGAVVRHIPKVLYHWRMTETSTAADPAAKAYAFSAGVRALDAHYSRMGIDADVTRLPYDGFYRTRYRLREHPLISVIIPNRNHIDDLRRCITSIEEKSSWPAVEFIIVENGSDEPETAEGYRELAEKYGNVRVVTFEAAFNYSAINNLGASFARGEYLLFLNNDTELIAEDSLENMMGLCMRKDVGAVGARLYFEDGTIQHAGVILGYGGIAGHAFREFGGEETGYQHRIICTQDLSAVTAACMMVRKAVFEELGGFFEGLAVAFNDIDLCLRCVAAGYRVVYQPYAEFYHYESKSRGYEDTPDKQARFRNEVRLFRERWKDVLAKGDPYYNPNLTLKKPDFTLRQEDEQMK